MPRRRAGTRAAHARLTEDERDVLLNGDGFCRPEDVFPTKAALKAAWFANREELEAAWAADADPAVPQSAHPWGYWEAESTTADPYRRAQLRAGARAIKRHRAAVAARHPHYKEPS